MGLAFPLDHSVRHRRAKWMRPRENARTFQRAMKKRRQPQESAMRSADVVEGVARNNQSAARRKATTRGAE